MCVNLPRTHARSAVFLLLESVTVNTVVHTESETCQKQWCAYALMYVHFVHSALGNKGGGVQLVYEGTCCLAWGLIFDGQRDRGIVCVFSILNAGVSVYECMCLYTHTHTHTAHMGYSVVSPGFGMKHLEAPKNPDALNLGIYVFTYVYKVQMCLYMLGGGMRSWTNCFFL